MNFGFNDEQELLRSEARKFLDQNASLEEVRRIGENEAAGYSKDLWSRMAELGWVGLTIPEAYGGAGLDFVTLVVVLEESGRNLLPSPLISTVLAARAIELAGTDQQRETLLPSLADGSHIGTFAHLEADDRYDEEGVQLSGAREGEDIVLRGSKRFVPDASSADIFVVSYRDHEGPALAIVRKDDIGVSTSDYASLDLTKRMGELELHDVRIPSARQLCQGDAAWSLIELLVDTGATLVAAESVGAAEGALAITTEFAKQRIQFDNPIGKYQSVKHPLAEMYVDIESFKSLTYYAAWCVDEGNDELTLAASRAKAYASEAFPRIGIDGVGLHGGVGYTWEYDIQLYLKRSKWARPVYGDADFHYERIASRPNELGGL